MTNSDAAVLQLTSGGSTNLAHSHASQAVSVDAETVTELKEPQC